MEWRMRGVLLLALGVLSLWAVIEFYPRSEMGEAEPGEAFAAEPVDGQGLRTGGDGPAQGSSSAQEPPSRPPRGEPGDREPDWLDRLGPPREALGAAIAHGSLEQLAGAIESAGFDLSDPHALLASSFAHAMAGEAREARELARGLALESDGLEREHVLLLQRALGAEAGPMAARASLSRDPLLRGMCMALEEDAAALQARAGAYASAAALYSDLLLAEIGAPWEGSREHLARWSSELERMQEGHRWNPEGDWPSVEIEVQAGDGLTDIRLRFLEENGGPPICTGLIARANRIGNRYLRPGEILRVPTDPVRTRVDLDLRWVLYMHGEQVVAAWNVGVGRPGHETRPGSYVVGVKKEEPMWFPAGRDPVPYGAQENPLGTRWIGWDVAGGGPSSLGFHGTNAPEGVGGAVSDGCIRMRNGEVEELFEVIPMGSPVLVTE